MVRQDAVARAVAVDRLLDRRPALLARAGTTTVGLDVVGGRAVAESVVAPATVPPVDFATMDGFAFAAADDYPLAVVGSVTPAEEPPALGPGEAVRVATGAPLPDRADVVLPREDATVTDGEVTGPPLDPGTNRYPAGRTADAGERLFEAGETLGARHAAFLRDVGVEEVTVRRRLSVGVLATGTEIHEGRQPDRDSEFLANLVRSWGHEPTLLGAVPDEAAAVRDAVEDTATAHDVVLTSGGTGFGDGDHVTGVLADHDLLFSGVDVRPGRLLVAAAVDDTPVCGLPGKPMAAYVAATLVVRALFAGRPGRATVRADPTTRVDLPDADYEYAVPVRLDDGEATPVGHGGSDRPLYGRRFAPGRVASSTRVALADGLAVTTDPLVPGEPLPVTPVEVVE